MLKVLFSRCALQNKITAINTREQHLPPCQRLATETFNTKFIFYPPKLSWGHLFHWRHWFLIKKNQQKVLKLLALELGIWAGCVSGCLGSSHKNQLQQHSQARTPPSQQPVPFLCGCRAVPKAKLSFHTGGRGEKKKKTKASAHPSLDQLFLQLKIA